MQPPDNSDLYMLLDTAVSLARDAYHDRDVAEVIWMLQCRGEEPAAVAARLADAVARLEVQESSDSSLSSNF